MKTSAKTRLSITVTATLSLLLTGCTSLNTPPVPKQGARVTILLYSGRPNPSFELNDTTQLAGLVAGLDAAKANPNFERKSVIKSQLGYAGITVLSAADGKVPMRFSVYRGDIEVQGEEKRFLSDGGAIEQTLLQIAQDQKVLDARQLEFIRTAR